MTEYAKLVEGNLVFAPSTYEVPGSATIFNFNKSETLVKEYGYKLFTRAQRDHSKNYKVSYEEHEDSIIEVLEEVLPDPEEEKRKERERLDSIALTPSDVERALYYGLGMDFEDLKALISSKAPAVNLKAISIEFRASNFYRGAVDRQGNRIVDAMGAVLGLTSEDLDYLFEHKTLSQETLDRLKPPVVEETEEPVVEETPEDNI